MFWRFKSFILVLLDVALSLFAELCVLLRMFSIPRAIYRVIIRVWPKSSGKYLHHLGFLSERQGDLAKAAEYYEDALQLEPLAGSRLWDLACIYERQGKIRLAIENYEKALELGRDFGTEFRIELQARIKRLKGLS